MDIDGTNNKGFSLGRVTLRKIKFIHNGNKKRTFEIVF